MITPKRSKRILKFLCRGGAINRTSIEGVYRFTLHHLQGSFMVTADEVEDLANEGALVAINCGCTGFWWVLRQDLIPAAL